MKILLVEDEQSLNRILSKTLKQNQYVVDAAFDGEEALDYVASSGYDLILLDIMMPKLDGYGFLERLRKEDVETPVLLLTAKDALPDKVKGLDLGADDYLVKPFELEELLARIRTLLRRKIRQAPQFSVQDIRIDYAQKTVYKADVPLDLTAKEYEVLEYLARNCNHFLTREQIREHVWDFAQESESNVIDVLIKNLRKKLETPIIVTKRGLGYAIMEK